MKVPFFYGPSPTHHANVGFRYDRKFFEKLYPEYYDIIEEELYEFRDGYCFVLFRDDLAALDAHQKALELRPKPLK